MHHRHSGNTGGRPLFWHKLASVVSSASENIGERRNGSHGSVKASSSLWRALSVGLPQPLNNALSDYDTGHEGDRNCLIQRTYQDAAVPSKWADAGKWLATPFSSTLSVPPESSVKKECPAGAESLSKLRTKDGSFHEQHRTGMEKHIPWTIKHKLQSHAPLRAAFTNNRLNANLSYPLWNEMDGSVQPPYSFITVKPRSALVDDMQGGNAKRPESLVNGMQAGNVKPLYAEHEHYMEWPFKCTKNLDAVKGVDNASLKFTFTPSPAPSLTEQSVNCFSIVADDLGGKKRVDVSHNQNYTKPMLEARNAIFTYPRASAPYDMPDSSLMHSIFMRDMGTEMTPIASQEPSQMGTPIESSTPIIRSPVALSYFSTPAQRLPAVRHIQGSDNGSSEVVSNINSNLKDRSFGSHGKVNAISWTTKEEEDMDDSVSLKCVGLEDAKKNVLKTRAAAWEETEKAKYMSRFEREEAKIQAWENHKNAQAEAELRKIELKLERMRSHTQEKLMNKIAAVRQKSEKRLALAEAKKCEEAMKTAESVDYIRRTGRLPSSTFMSGWCRSNSSVRTAVQCQRCNTGTPYL